MNPYQVICLSWPGLAHAVMDSAVVIVAPEPTPAQGIKLLQMGVQDVLARRHENDDRICTIAWRSVITSFGRRKSRTPSGQRRDCRLNPGELGAEVGSPTMKTPRRSGWMN
jgi:hypothetical protein